MVDWISRMFVGLEPELVWGLFPRLIGLVFLISFASLLPQALAIAGRDGVAPFALKARKMREAFVPWRRWLHFPTLLWLDSSDRMLRALLWGGIACALLVMYGGPAGFWGMLGCYVVYISLDKPLYLMLPWDCMLFEMAFLGLFLEPWHALPELSAAAAPAPLVVWAYRLLVFRLMLGFGKTKFTESGKADRTYLSGFLVYQPLPTPIAWYAAKAPPWVLQGALFVMFVAEVPAPFLVFHPELGIVTAVMTSVLMVGIQLCGNFGFFNVLAIIACLPLLDTVTPAQLQLGSLFSADAPVFTNAVVLLHLAAALLAFPFNSWVSQHWHHWTVFHRLPRWLELPVAFCRVTHALRWAHPYGVFPPRTQPAVKLTPVVEVSWDGECWQEVEFPYAATHPRSAPRFISPHHHRADQQVMYEALGLNSQSQGNSLALPGDPFFYSRYSVAHALMQRILEGRYYPGVYTRRGSLDPDRPPPRWARMRMFLMVPTTLDDKRRTGCYWHRAYIAPHVPPISRSDEFWQHGLPGPELWQWEMVTWRRWSRLRPLMKRAERGRETSRQLITRMTDLGDRDLDGFWNEFIEDITRFDRNDWQALPDVRDELTRRYGLEGLRHFERVLAFLGVIAAARLEPLFFRRLFRPRIPVKNYGRLWMLAQDVVWDGEAAFDGMLRDPMSVAGRAAELTLNKGLYFTAVLRYDSLVFEAQKLRLLWNFMESYHQLDAKQLEQRQRLFDLAEHVSVFAEILFFLQDQLKGPRFDQGYPEQHPEYELLPSGIVRVKPGSVHSWEPLDHTAPPPARDAR